jgi:hypothetical protein
MDAAVGIVLVAVLAGAFVWSPRDAARDPQRYRGVMNSRRRLAEREAWAVLRRLGMIDTRSWNVAAHDRDRRGFDLPRLAARADERRLATQGAGR